MYKRMKRKKLGRTKSHREALVINQIRTLFSSGVLNTTTAKAKVIKGKAQSILESVKTDLDLREKKEISRVLGGRDVFDKVAEYVKKDSCAVRIVKVGFRAGDNAQMSKLELVDFKVKKKAVKSVEKKEEEEIKDTPKKEVNKDIEKRTQRKSLSGNVKKTKQVRATSRSGL